MSKPSDLSEYKRLFELYNKKTDEELSKIASSESTYTEIAKKVAFDILQSDRTEYYEEINKKQQEREENLKVDKDKIILNMQNDINSIKNMLLFFVILTIIGLLFGAYTVFVTIPNLF